jgi:hypothetical protein
MRKLPEKNVSFVDYFVMFETFWMLKVGNLQKFGSREEKLRN